MPIHGLTGRVRTPRWARIRLGYTKQGRNSKYPGDTDVFVVKREGDAEMTKAILDAYGGEAIKDASEPGVFQIGRAIRLMLPWEFDTVHEGREVSLELANRSWAASKLRCSGDGGGAEPELVGTAVCRDDAYRRAFERAGLVLGDAPRGAARVTCKGVDCPMWHTNRTSDNKLPGCHREMRLQALLLHPATNPEDPDYMRQIGWVEIATGSWNGAVDVQSGFTMLRAMVGRTAAVPFTLRRLARSISTPEGRVVKATLVVGYDMDEALRFGLGPPARAMLRAPVRRELLELASAELQFASVADIQPQHGSGIAVPSARPALPAAPVLDRDEAVSIAEQTAPGETEEDEDEPLRALAQPEVDELKVACGGTPGQVQTLASFWERVEASYEAVGIWTDPKCTEWRAYPGRREGQGVTGKYLTTRHRAWIEDQLRAEHAEPGDEPRAGVVVDPDDIPEEVGR